MSIEQVIYDLDLRAVRKKANCDHQIFVWEGQGTLNVKHLEATLKVKSLEAKDCAKCHRTGEFEAKRCEECKGKGAIGHEPPVTQLIEWVKSQHG